MPTSDRKHNQVKAFGQLRLFEIQVTSTSFIKWLHTVNVFTARQQVRRRRWATATECSACSSRWTSSAALSPPILPNRDEVDSDSDAGRRPN